MTRKNFIVTFTFFILTISACGQTNSNRVKLGEANARNKLKVALTDTTIHNVIGVNSLLIKNKETAINVVEPILFAIYSKDNIIKQRPYDIYLIDNYWVVSGTLTKGYLGRTFLIIVDATNSKIIRLTHGK